MRTIVKVFVGWTLGLIQKEELRMRKSVVLTMAATLVVAAAALPTPAAAADVGAVLKACDNMKARGEYCEYETGSDGTIGGCTGKVCFECPADGKRQCHQTTRTLQGKFQPVKGDLLMNMTGTPGKGQPGTGLPRRAPVGQPCVAK